MSVSALALKADVQENTRLTLQVERQLNSRLHGTFGLWGSSWAIPDPTTGLFLQAKQEPGRVLPKWSRASWSDSDDDDDGDDGDGPARAGSPHNRGPRQSWPDAGGVDAAWR